MKSLVSLALVLLFSAPSNLKMLSFDIEKTQINSTEKHVEHLLQQLSPKTIPVNMIFSPSPYIYTSIFTFGSNKQKAKMRFTTDTDWTMVTGADCYRCGTKAYNVTTSVTAKNGTHYKPENQRDGMKYAGTTYSDILCIESNNVCADDFEFFVIRNQSDETRNSIMRTDGVIGLAPDRLDNGPSFLAALKSKNVIEKFQVGVRMIANAQLGQISRMTLGGIDESQMLPFPSANNKKFYNYDNKDDGKEWGTELRNIYIGNSTHNFSIDSGKLTYAKVDTFSPYIQLPIQNFKKYKEYLNKTHPEMICLGDYPIVSICYVPDQSCDAIIKNFQNITLRFNDTLGFHIPPKSYLRTETQ